MSLDRLASLFPRFGPLVTAWLLLFCGAAVAAEISVGASLTSTATGVGEPVEYQIKVNGGRGLGEAPEVRADGLEIGYLGPSSSTSMRFDNGKFVTESSVVYRYQVAGSRAGEFTIPAVKVAVDGKAFRTNPVALKVESSGAQKRDGEQQMGFMEVELSKKTAYVGEMLPMEVRLAIDARGRGQPEVMPTINGEGFTKQKFPEPRPQRMRVDNREMDVFVFRTAISPGKAGKIPVGPVEISYIAQVPRAQRNRPRSVFDMFDDNVFGDPFFAVNQRFKGRADAVELEVKPLPAVGRPQNFSGAVGQFTFSAEGSPQRVKIGDPLTMKLTVSGRGNFDRIEAPVLSDPTGWRVYPPSTNFKAEDDIGVSGSKTFDLAVIPEASKTAMPQFEFSYFDPAAGKYVTLKSEAKPLVVEGTPPKPVVPPVSPEPQPETRPDASAVPPPEPADILGLRYDAGNGRATFEPLYARRGFLLAQLIPLAALAALLLSRFWRRDPDAGRASAWRKEKALLLGKLRADELPEQEFFETAARVVQLDTALASGRTPGSIDAAAACSSRQLDAEIVNGIDRIFTARAALLYAGGETATTRLSGEERREVLANLAKFEKGHARA
ncbi:MAG: hypothetical protein QOE70_6047 [Chthoniobacter sp.]|jgi:hypothetical protein|nr:hypothetical protein [Chthoniobacter sp.]